MEASGAEDREKEGTLLWRAGLGSPPRGPKYRAGGTPRFLEHRTSWNTMSPEWLSWLFHLTGTDRKPHNYRRGAQVHNRYVSCHVAWVEAHPWPDPSAAESQGGSEASTAVNPGNKGLGVPRLRCPFVKGRYYKVKIRGRNATMHQESS